MPLVPQQDMVKTLIQAVSSLCQPHETDKMAADAAFLSFPSGHRFSFLILELCYFFTIGNMLKWHTVSYSATTRMRCCSQQEFIVLVTQPSGVSELFFNLYSG